MNQTEELSRMFAELGETTPEVDEVVQPEGAPSWGVAFDGGIEVLAELDEDSGLLELSCDLGPAPEQNRLAVCETLLAYNTLRGVTGGVAMALAEPGGSFQQLASLPAAGLQLGALKAALLNFAAKGAVWRQVVASGATPEPDAEDGLSGPMHSGLRV